MPGQVTYACNCLNVKVHLAKKYDLESHQEYRDSKFDPVLSGWQFQIGMSGVVVEYPSLVFKKHALDCTIISCLICNSGDIYSVKIPIDSDQIVDRVTIYKEAIFGNDIVKLQRQDTYSDAFHVVLNPNLPVNHVSLEKVDNTLDSGSQSQQKYIKQILKKALVTLEDATEKKIQAYQKEQELLLDREKEKARYEGAVLWQTMKEILRAKQGQHEVNENTPNQAIFNHNLSVVTPHDVLEMHYGESPAHDSASDKNDIQQRRRSSVFARDLFGEHAPNLDHRKTSHVLDENSLAHSFKKNSVDELPPFQRRASLIPQNVHPLASASTHKTETNITLPRSSCDGEANQENTFALDEDIDESNIPRKKSVKYLEIFDAEDESNASKFATSHSPTVTVKDEIIQNRHVHPSSCLIEPTYFKESGRRPSFVGFDCAQVDREISSQFKEQEKKD